MGEEIDNMGIWERTLIGESAEGETDKWGRGDYERL